MVHNVASFESLNGPASPYLSKLTHPVHPPSRSLRSAEQLLPVSQHQLQNYGTFGHIASGRPPRDLVSNLFSKPISSPSPPCKTEFLDWSFVLKLISTLWCCPLCFGSVQHFGELCLIWMCFTNRLGLDRNNGIIHGRGWHLQTKKAYPSTPLDGKKNGFFCGSIFTLQTGNIAQSYANYFTTAKPRFQLSARHQLRTQPV